MCAEPKARAASRDAGSPEEGPLSEDKNRLRRAVRKRVHWCVARSERLRVQKRDRLFVTQDSRRFKTPQMKKSRCSKLVVRGEKIQDPETLLKVWAEHFQKLDESRLGDTLEMISRKDKM